VALAARSDFDAEKFQTNRFVTRIDRAENIHPLKIINKK
jgi:hypothetical protein